MISFSFRGLIKYRCSDQGCFRIFSEAAKIRKAGVSGDEQQFMECKILLRVRSTRWLRNKSGEYINQSMLYNLNDSFKLLTYKRLY